MVRQLVPLPGRGLSLEVDVLASKRTHRAEGAAPGDVDYTTGANDGANSPDGCGPTLVVLHPWSWLGGCMDDHVVVAVCRSAVASGRFASVVRYNMRGAGASGGSRSLLPSVDAADLVALARHLLQLPPTVNGQPQGQQQQPASWPSARLVLAGYSYGGVVAGRALPQLRPHVVALAAVALPLGLLCRLLLGSGAAWSAITGATPRGAHHLPRLLCCGDKDQFTNVRQLQGAVQKAQLVEGRTTAAASSPALALPPKAGPSPASGPSLAAPRGPFTAASSPPPSSSSLELVVWPGCDHFFVDCWDPGALPEEPEEPQAATVGGGDRAVGGGGGAGRQPVKPWEVLGRFVVRWLVTRMGEQPGGYARGKP